MMLTSTEMGKEEGSFQEGGSSSEWPHWIGAGHCSVLGEAEVVGGQLERYGHLF